MAKMGNKMIALCSAAIGTLYITSYINTTPIHADIAQINPTVTASINNVTNSEPINKKISAAIDNVKKSTPITKATSTSPDTNTTNTKTTTTKTTTATATKTNTATKTTTSKSTPTTKTTTSQPTTSTKTTTTTKPATKSTTTKTSKTVTTNKKYKDGTFYGVGRNRIGAVEVAVTIKQDKIISVQIVQCTTSYPEYYISALPDQVVSRQSANVDTVSGATRSTEDFRMAVMMALKSAQI